jgi:hypothetical protein
MEALNNSTPSLDYPVLAHPLLHGRLRTPSLDYSIKNEISCQEKECDCNKSKFYSTHGSRNIFLKWQAAFLFRYDDIYESLTRIVGKIEELMV